MRQGFLRIAPVWRSLPIVAFAMLVAVTGSLSAGVQGRSFDLQTANVRAIQDAVAAGALTYERLVQLYLARVSAYDKQGPRLNAIIHVNPRAEVRRRTGTRSPLHGIPIAVKDNVDVRDLPYAGGNIAFAVSYPPRDATVFEKLRAAGAIIFLKTYVDEFALGSQGLS